MTDFENQNQPINSNSNMEALHSSCLMFLDNLHANLLDCEQHCKTCNKFILQLSQHMRKAHARVKVAQEGSSRSSTTTNREPNSYLRNTRTRSKSYQFYILDRDPLEITPLTNSRKRNSHVESAHFLTFENTDISEVKVDVEDVEFGTTHEQYEETHNQLTNINAITVVDAESKKTLHRITLFPEQITRFSSSFSENKDPIHEQVGLLNNDESLDDLNKYTRHSDANSDGDDDDYVDRCSDSEAESYEKTKTPPKLDSSRKVKLKCQSVDKNLDCSLCPRKFSIGYLNRHYKRGHRPDPKSTFPVCNTCKKLFPTSKHLNYHVRKAHADPKAVTPFTCHICQRKFNQPKEVKVHFNESHQGEKPFACDSYNCNLKYSVYALLKYHMRTHTGEKPFVCDICKKDFSTSSQVTRHMRSHTEERLYTCDTCGKSYKHLEGLTIHKRTHTGDKPFMCEFCSKCFTSNSLLSNHKSSHIRERSHPCEYCKKSFITRNGLNTHTKIHIGKKKKIKV